ncbi:MAG: hypothetical protein C0490_19835, partial [Marivirga sp.]|nr:hypothetical protein [Marivirga sp.]
VNAREVIDQGKLLYDSGNYPAAIEKYLTIPKRDTAYVYMLSELALAYLGNKEYDKAITACKEGLQDLSIYRAHFLRSEAVATDRKGNFSDAVGLFEKAISIYPFDYGLIFNLGITYYNHKDYDKARDCFFRVLSIYPFHQGSHLNLAILSAAQGKKTHAMLSFGIYLGINNEDNKRLVLLENVVSNQFADEGSIPFQGKNAFEKLDQIIRARIAMESSYKSKIDFDAAIVKQFQMFFDQLSTVDTQMDDPWSTYYVSIYQSLKEKDMIEPFIYHILKSTNNEKVTKWTKKNEKRINAFYDLTNTSIWKKREKILAPEAGITQLTQAWYAKDNKLEAVGHKDTNGVRQGEWIFYHSNAEKSAKGSYDVAGEKSGTWQFFRKDGSVSSVENYETGEVRVFNEGVLSQFFYLKNSKIHGTVELYNPCGILQEKLSYKEGKKSGAGSIYFSSGKLKQTYHFENDNLNGELVNYFESGQVLSKMSYHDDLLNGPYIAFHANGKLEMTGAYAAGELEGNWKYYHGNGRLERTGNFAKGLAVGEWLYYDTRGINTERRLFDNAGNYDGDQIVFYNGKVYYVNTYKN